MTVLNEHLELIVSQELLHSSDVSSRNVVATADNGTITLQGNVPSYSRKLEVHRIVENIPAVDQVVNHLNVVAGNVNSSDLDLAVKCNRYLTENSSLIDSAIRVDVNAGRAALTGYVKSETQALLAVDVVHSVPGIECCDSFLRVNADRVEKNHQASEKIVAALQNTIGLQDESIIVSVVDNSARISGIVDCEWKKELVEEIVRRHEILQVVNDIQVQAG